MHSKNDLKRHDPAISPHSSGTGNAGQREFRLNERNSVAECDAREFFRNIGKRSERSWRSDFIQEWARCCCCFYSCPTMMDHQHMDTKLE